MQAAIDLVFRSFAFRQPTWRTNEPEREVMRQDAEAVAENLFQNFKNHLADHHGRTH